MKTTKVFLLTIATYPFSLFSNQNQTSDVVGSVPGGQKIQDVEDVEHGSSCPKVWLVISCRVISAARASHAAIACWLLYLMLMLPSFRTGGDSGSDQPVIELPKVNYLLSLLSLLSLFMMFHADSLLVTGYSRRQRSVWLKNVPAPNPTVAHVQL